MNRAKKNQPHLQDYRFPSQSMDEDALQVVRRLQRFGYLGYFVGGCVRDILLGAQPKDFDIATSARPREVKQIFRTCRLIGRRFKLAHIHISRDKILEVATFRQKPSNEGLEEGLIIEDNEFGTAETDAYRRDFTINALFYDPMRHQLHDYCGGLKDIQEKRLRSIGDPVERFREDPIRMLRAIKFAARLSLQFNPPLERALYSERLELGKVANPRLLQELLRMLQGGVATSSFELLERFEFLSLLAPELIAAWSSVPETHRLSLALFQSLDRSRERNRMGDEVLLAILWWPVYQTLIKRFETTTSRQAQWVAYRLFTPFSARVGMSMKLLRGMTRILTLQEMIGRNGMKGARGSFVREATQLFELRTEVEDVPEELLQELRAFNLHDHRVRDPLEPDLSVDKTRRGRRRGRRARS
jgi:poly(A) polymerase